MSPELRLVAACCRWPDDASRAAAITACAAQVQDWPKVISLATAHRVIGFLGQALPSFGQAAPDEVRTALIQQSDNVRTTALTQAAETLRLSGRFAAQGLRHRILKGVPLGIAAYGTPSLKSSWDIDLLVEPEDAVAAVRLLRELGYRPARPTDEFEDRDFARWAVVTKELILYSGSGPAVELHWRVSDHPMLLQGIDAAGPGSEVDVLAGRTVPTLSVPANLAYLAVHGAFHGWSRLKWLADFSALLRAINIDAGQIQEARAFAPGLALDQALILSNRFFGVPTEKIAIRSHAVERIVELAGAVIAARSPERDIEADPAAQRNIRAVQWRLHPSVRYRALMALLWLRGSEDRKTFALPKGIAWAYWLARPFTGGYRFVARRVGGRRARNVRER